MLPVLPVQASRRKQDFSPTTASTVRFTAGSGQIVPASYEILMRLPQNSHEYKCYALNLQNC